jgi:hypothetical protein
MHRSRSCLLIALLAVLCLAACQAAAPQAAAPASRPSTPTRQRPRSTPRATLAPTPSSADTLRAAFARARKRTTYQIGWVTSHGSTSPNEHVPTLAYNAVFRPHYTHYFLLDDSFIAGGFNSDNGTEAIVDGDTTFARGPLPWPGAPWWNIWYRLSPDQAALLRPPFVLPQLIDLLTRKIDVTTFQEVGPVTYMSQPCTLYRGSRDAAFAVLDNLGLPLTPHEQAREATPVAQRYPEIDWTQTDLTARLCGAQSLRTIELVIAGHNRQFPDPEFMVTASLVLDLASPFPSDDDTSNAVPLTDVTPARGRLVREEGLYWAPWDHIARAVLPASAEVAVLDRSRDGRWYRVLSHGTSARWVLAEAVAVEQGALGNVPVAPPISGVRAYVTNGGNVRAEGSLQGKVLDQVNAGEMLPVHAISPDGRWYQVTTPRNVTGWVSVTLLDIDPALAPWLPLVSH